MVFDLRRSEPVILYSEFLEKIPELGPIAVTLYCVLCDITRNRLSPASSVGLASRVGCDEHLVMEARDRLVSFGFLQKTQEDGVIFYDLVTPNWVPPLPPPLESMPPPSRTFIYLMRHERNLLVKIGRSKTPLGRILTIQSEEPEVTMLFYIPGLARVERELHLEYADKRVRGEWFRLTDGDIAAIKAKLEAANA